MSFYQRQQPQAPFDNLQAYAPHHDLDDYFIPSSFQNFAHGPAIESSNQSGCHVSQNNCSSFESRSSSLASAHDFNFHKSNESYEHTTRKHLPNHPSAPCSSRGSSSLNYDADRRWNLQQGMNVQDDLLQRERAVIMFPGTTACNRHHGLFDESLKSFGGVGGSTTMSNHDHELAENGEGWPNPALWTGTSNVRGDFFHPCLDTGRHSASGATSTTADSIQRSTSSFPAVCVSCEDIQDCTQSLGSGQQVGSLNPSVLANAAAMGRGGDGKGVLEYYREAVAELLQQNEMLRRRLDEAEAHISPASGKGCRDLNCSKDLLSSVAQRSMALTNTIRANSTADSVPATRPAPSNPPLQPSPTTASGTGAGGSSARNLGAESSSECTEGEECKGKEGMTGNGARFWTRGEHTRFLEGLHMFGGQDAHAIASHVGTRTVTQVRTHAQKYFLKLARIRSGARDKGPCRPSRSLHDL